MASSFRQKQVKQSTGLKPLLCDLHTPREKSKNTRPPPGLTTHQTRSMHAPYNFLIRSYANTHTPA